MAVLTTPGSCAGRLTGTCPVTGGPAGSGPGPLRGRGRALGTGQGVRGKLLLEGLEQIVKNKIDERMGVK